MNSLFDDDTEEPEEWIEVPASIYLAWPEKTQLLYCANRDLFDARNEDDPWWAEFFLNRAKAYLTKTETL